MEARKLDKRQTLFFKKDSKQEVILFENGFERFVT